MSEGEGSEKWEECSRAVLGFGALLQVFQQRRGKCAAFERVFARSEQVSKEKGGEEEWNQAE